MESELVNLSNLASFVTNATEPINGRYSDSKKVSVLVSLLASGAEIERLKLSPYTFGNEFSADIASPDPDQLACAVKHSSVRSLIIYARMDEDPLTLLTMTKDEMYQKLAESIGTQLERLKILSADFRLDDIASFQALLARCTRITHVTLRSCSFDDQCERKLDSRIASQLQSLESLKLYYVIMDDSSLAKLLGELHGLIHLSELIIFECPKFGKKCAAAICGFARLKQLELVSIGSLDDEDMTALAEGSPVFALRRLIFGSNRIGPMGGASLARMIARCPNLCELGLPDNQIGPGAAKKLGEAVKHSGCAMSLCRLDITMHNLGQTGVVALFSATNFPALTSLRMGMNAAGDAGAKAVSDCLLRSRAKLVELHAKCNDITAIGAADLLRVLGWCSILGLQKNQIGPEGGVAVINQLISAGGRHLEELGLSWCNIGDIGAEAVGRLIGCGGCSRIKLKNNEIHAAGAKAIVDACRVAQRISILDLSGNPIGDQGAGYIAEGIIKTNRAVEDLRMWKIWIKDSGASSIIAALKERNREGTLRALTLFEPEFTEEQQNALEQLAGGDHNQSQFKLNIGPLPFAL